MYYPLDRHLLPEQRDVLAAAKRLWAVYAPLLREQEGDLAGGMQWRLVDGVQYLSRYRPDPEGRSRKIAKSLGRRSTKTEGLFNSFIARRDAVQQQIAEFDVRLDLVVRAARGMGLARLSRLDAERLSRLRRADFFDPSNSTLLPLGAPALAGYEALHGTLAQENVLRDYGGDDAMTLYVRGSSADEALGRRVARALFSAKIEPVIARHGAGCITISTVDTEGKSFREVELVSWEAVELGLHLRDRPVTNAARRTIREVLEELPPVEAIVPAGDGTLQGFPILDPRAYAIASRLAANGGSRAAHEDLVAFRRASFVAWSIREGVMPPAFTEAQEQTLAAIGMPNALLGYDPTYDPGPRSGSARSDADEPASDDETGGYAMSGP